MERHIFKMYGEKINLLLFPGFACTNVLERYRNSGLTLSLHLLQNWVIMKELLSERLQTLEAVLTKLEKGTIEMGFKSNDEVTQNIQKHVYTSINQTCKSLKARIFYSMKHLSGLKS